MTLPRPRTPLYTVNAMQSKSKPKAYALPLLRLLPVRVVGVQADTDCWAAEACVLAQVRRTEDALRAAPGNATLRMLLWYQVRVLLPAHALPPCRHAFRTDISCFPHRPANLGGKLGCS